LLIAVVTVSSAWRDWASAQYTIKANGLPLANQDVLPSEPAGELRPEPSSSDAQETQDAVAQADVSRPVEPAPSNVNSSAEAKPAVPTRFGYDLEHGIPMPPDARESKPVY
jgi:hypothetical protein